MDRFLQIAATQQSPIVFWSQKAPGAQAGRALQMQKHNRHLSAWIGKEEAKDSSESIQFHPIPFNDTLLFKLLK